MATPKRIQRLRAKGWRMPPNTVYVGRPSLWGNPWSIEDAAAHGTDVIPMGERRAWLVQKYRRELQHWGMCSDWSAVVSEARYDALLRDIARTGAKNMAAYAPHALRGKNLACWCPLDQPCHADVLLKIANGKE